MKKIWEWMKKHPNPGALGGSIVVGIVVMSLYLLWEDWTISDFFHGETWLPYIGEYLVVGVLLGAIIGVFLIYPFILTLFNLTYLFREGTARIRRTEHWTEGITIVLGVAYSFLYLALFSGATSGIQFSSDWQAVLNRGQLHTPIWTAAALSVIVFSCVGIIGYLMLSFRDINRMPPLLTVLSISAVYVGILMCVLWIIQIFQEEWLLCLFPANCVLIGAKKVRRAVESWQGNAENQTKEFRSPYLNQLNHWLLDASRWSGAAFLLMLPLLGMLIGILTLFGQQPDSIIRAWTETSDWTLSQRMAPPSVVYDEHYLCTVAAQGHPEVVKPLRGGIRHGHQVTVNRQLCIANAFEQVLEERAAWLHGPVRRFYDRFGFPVARLIHTRYAADVVYYVMKPLEWIFLAVLYLVDEKPENRIAVQYPHAAVPEWK